MTDENYEFNPETDLWIPKVSRRKFFFLGALSATAAALGLSSVSDIPRAVVPMGMLPTPVLVPDSGLWTVTLDPLTGVHNFWFVDAGLKWEQRNQSHLEFWKETRRIVVSGEVKGRVAVLVEGEKA